MTLNDLLKELDVTKWDLLFIGDGSGTGWKEAVGWSCISVDRKTGVRNLHMGGTNHGTIGQAEVLPYLDALRYDFYVAQKGKLTSLRRVVILSDSDVSVKIGNGEYDKHTNRDIWCAMDFFKEQGYDISWKWVGRNENDLHVLAHNTANVARKVAKAEEEIDVYKILPTEGPYVIDIGSDWGF